MISYVASSRLPDFRFLLAASPIAFLVDDAMLRSDVREVASPPAFSFRMLRADALFRMMSDARADAMRA